MMRIDGKCLLGSSRTVKEWFYGEERMKKKIIAGLFVGFMAFMVPCGCIRAEIIEEIVGESQEIIVDTGEMDNAEDVLIENGFVYTINDTGDSAVITGYVGTETIVEIPVYLNHYPVVGIGDNAFAGTDIEELKITSSIDYIGDYILKDSKVRKIILEGDANISVDAFAGYEEDCLKTFVCYGNPVLLNGISGIKENVHIYARSDTSMAEFALKHNLDFYKLDAMDKNAITLTNVDSNTRKIQWEPVSGISGYAVYRSQDAEDGDYELVGRTTETFLMDTDMDKEKSYYYTICIYHQYGGEFIDGIGICKKSKDYISLNDPGISIQHIKSVLYTGKAIKPVVSVKYNGKVLKVNTDYKITYKNNVKKGKATIVITGLHSYYGTETLHFTIVGIGKTSISSAQVYSSRTIKLSWKKAANAKGYIIYRASSLNGKYGKIKTITNSSTLSYTDKNLTGGKKYYYMIKPYAKQDGKYYYGSYSNKASCTAIQIKFKEVERYPFSNGGFYFRIESIDGNKMYFSTNMPYMSTYYERATIHTNGSVATASIRCGNGGIHKLTISVEGSKIKVVENSSCRTKYMSAFSGDINGNRTFVRYFYPDSYFYRG